MSHEDHDHTPIPGAKIVVTAEQMQEAIQEVKDSGTTKKADHLFGELATGRIAFLNLIGDQHQPQEIAQCVEFVREAQSQRDELLARIQAEQTGRLASAAHRQSTILTWATVVLAVATIALIWATLID